MQRQIISPMHLLVTTTFWLWRMHRTMRGVVLAVREVRTARLQQRLKAEIHVFFSSKSKIGLRSVAFLLPSSTVFFFFFFFTSEQERDDAVYF